MENPERKKSVELVLILVALVIGIVSLTMTLMSRRIEKSYANVPEENDAQPPESEVTVINILAGGTARYGSNAAAAEDYSSCFSQLAQIVPNFDVAVYNQTSMIGTDLPEAFANAALDTGFNMVALASPDALLYGKTGIETSLNYWQNSSALYAGTYLSTDASNMITTRQYGSITVTYLSFTDVLNEDLPDQQTYLVSVYDEETSVQLVQKADEAADVVIVDICWEGQDQSLPTDRQTEIAQKLADAGASVIVGHAENAIQPISWIDDTLIFYSLGSLIDDSGTQPDALGCLGAVTVTKTTLEDKQRVELTNPQADLIVSVLQEDGQYQIQMLSESGIDSSDTLYETYSGVLQMMDDSIRIGGLQ